VREGRRDLRSRDARGADAVVRGQIVFAAMRNVAAGEELTIDYATTDDDDSESPCACGAPACRKVLSGRDWQRPELQARYAGWFSSYLEARIRRGKRD
jgi:hypothetical protein